MEQTSNRNWILPVIIGLLAFICICCLCLAAVGAAGMLAYLSVQDETLSPESWQVAPSATPVVVRPTRPAASATPLPSATMAAPGPTAAFLEPTQPAPTPVPRVSQGAETLKLLQEAEVPPRDLAELAKRLEGKGDFPPTLEPPATSPQVGDRKQFWVSNTDTNENFQVEAQLEYITDHAYFWVEQGVSFRERDLVDLAQAFEEKIYPTNREFFGSEWSPGVDGDVRLYILYASGVGGSVAGYFSSLDSLNPAIVEYSNGHEMFVFNADNVGLREDFTYGVLAHEFQHMIHWYRDRNETTWLNEGFSDLAMFLNGYDIGGHDYLYVSDPDLQLNDWPNDPALTSAHYGASFLFVTYFLDRFGEEATQALVGHPANDLESVDLVLAELGSSDPLTGQTLSADDVFGDWVLATFLQDDQVGDGRYTYTNYRDVPQTSYTESIYDCGEAITRDVRQYGADYIRLQCDGQVTLRFEGSLQTGLLPVEPYSGSYAFWSNKGDESSISLTRSFDFTDASGPLTLSYWTWYDIEEDFDYVYLLASEDGQRWEMLRTPSGTDADPTGANYGWAYNGESGTSPEWIQEEVDLSQFAGKTIQLRFEYITDAAVNGEGFLLDDISIPEIDYFSDFEQDDGGWQAQGFVRVQNVLPQTFRLSLIRFGDQTTVQPIALSPENDVEITLDFGDGLQQAVLVVSGLTRYTRQPAAYRLVFP